MLMYLYDSIIKYPPFGNGVGDHCFMGRLRSFITEETFKEKDLHTEVFFLLNFHCFIYTSLLTSTSSPCFRGFPQPRWLLCWKVFPFRLFCLLLEGVIAQFPHCFSWKFFSSPTPSFVVSWQVNWLSLLI
ncbi:hypothetical protein Pfo_002773 [Paulownia fortunei]|nr:hypothetical protein Pfo_002773 [Paulownia fortunei]